MATRWRIRRRMTDFGPFTGEQVRTLARQGKLRADDLIWKERPEDGATPGHFEGLEALMLEGNALRAASTTRIPAVAR